MSVIILKTLHYIYTKIDSHTIEAQLSELITNFNFDNDNTKTIKIIRLLQLTIN